MFRTWPSISEVNDDDATYRMGEYFIDIIMKTRVDSMQDYVPLPYLNLLKIRILSNVIMAV